MYYCRIHRHKVHQHKFRGILVGNQGKGSSCLIPMIPLRNNTILGHRVGDISSWLDKCHRFSRSKLLMSRKGTYCWLGKCRLGSTYLQTRIYRNRLSSKCHARSTFRLNCKYSINSLGMYHLSSRLLLNRNIFLDLFQRYREVNCKYSNQLLSCNRSIHCFSKYPHLQRSIYQFHSGSFY